MEKKVELTLGDRVLPFIDKESLRANKQATGRPQDIADLQAME